MDAEVKIIKTSSEGIMAVDSNYVSNTIGVNRFSVNNLFSPLVPKKLKHLWIYRNKPLWFCNTMNRVFMYVRSMAGNYYWMDVVTGTLYNLDGQCMSGTLWLNILGLKQDQQKCETHLLSIDISDAH